MLKWRLQVTILFIEMLDCFRVSVSVCCCWSGRHEHKFEKFLSSRNGCRAETTSWVESRSGFLPSCEEVNVCFASKTRNMISVTYFLFSFHFPLFVVFFSWFTSLVVASHRPRQTQRMHSRISFKFKKSYIMPLCSRSRSEVQF